jgi:hypothetical protein
MGFLEMPSRPAYRSAIIPTYRVEFRTVHESVGTQIAAGVNGVSAIGGTEFRSVNYDRHSIKREWIESDVDAVIEPQITLARLRRNQIESVGRNATLRKMGSHPVPSLSLLAEHQENVE